MSLSSTSPHTTSSEAWCASCAVAANVSDGTYAVSMSCCVLFHSMANLSAAVPLLTNTAYRAPTYSANLYSNSAVTGPVVIQPDFNVLTTLLISGVPIDGLQNGTFIIFSLVFLLHVIYQRH